MGKLNDAIFDIFEKKIQNVIQKLCDKHSLSTLLSEEKVNLNTNWYGNLILDYTTQVKNLTKID
jgi:hypothetical protein